MRLFIIVIAVLLSLVPIIYTLLTILEEKIKLKSYSRGKAIAELEHREAIQLYKEFLNGEIEVKHKSRAKIRRAEQESGEMPYISSKIRLPQELDRRRKLTEEQKEEIRHKYNTGLYSQRQLAAEYGVSRRLIVFIIHPDRYERNKELLKERKKDGRYQPTKEEWAKTVREHRRYKQTLYVEGKISRRTRGD